MLGITLPMHNVQAGVYAEEETRRLVAAFDSLFYSLADKRLHFLPRESDPQKVPGAYEFPREFRKLRNAVVQFLVDVGRPSQLRTSPFLRGFYFTGVRPVTVQDTPLPTAPPSSRQKAQASGHATGMFQAMRPGAAAQPVPQPQYTGSKRVPQWVFVSRLFNQVILQDQCGAGGQRIEHEDKRTAAVASDRRVAAAVLHGDRVHGFVLQESRDGEQCGCSGRGDSRDGSGRHFACIARFVAAAGNAAPGTGAVDRDIESKVIRSAWAGCFTPATICIRICARPITTASDSCCSRRPRARLRSHLQRLPAAPASTDDYGLPYEILKGYLITTVQNDKVTDASPAPILLSRWAEGRSVDAQSMQLAQKQFVFYAKDLKNGNPFSSTGDNDAVARGRSYLAQFSGIERVYQFMLSQAGKGIGELQSRCARIPRRPW